MTPDPTITLPNDLSPDTVIALLDLLHSVGHALRQQYGDEWDELMTREQNPYPATRQTLDFDDDIPF